MITRTKLFESKLQKYQWSRILSSTKGPAREILNESSRNPDPRSRNLQLWSWKINSPKINASYYSKFQSLVSRLANALSGQANHKIRTSDFQKSKLKIQIEIQKYLYPEIFSSYISKFQSLVSRLANALSGQANHKIRTPQEPEKWAHLNKSYEKIKNSFFYNHLY